MEYKLHKRTLRHVFSMPFIWIVLIPIVILDIFLEIYHRICFPLYGLPYVKRKEYIRIDRQRLKYLSTFDKISCMYCGYANGLAHYMTVIAGNTEAYWCAIKHKQGKGFKNPAHHKPFLDYGDEKGYRKKYCKKN